LADAHGSGPCTRKGVEVQVLSSAPKSRRKYRLPAPPHFSTAQTNCVRRLSRCRCAGPPSKIPAGTSPRTTPIASVPAGIRSRGGLAPTLQGPRRHGDAADAAIGPKPMRNYLRANRRSPRSICTQAPGRLPPPHIEAVAARTVPLRRRSRHTRSKEYRLSQILRLTVAVSYLATSYPIERESTATSCVSESKLMLRSLHPAWWICRLKRWQVRARGEL
jgi:hypothetical protein